jgi:hypothetical protein
MTRGKTSTPIVHRSATQIKELVRNMTGPRDQRRTATELLQSQLFKEWSPGSDGEEMRLDQLNATSPLFCVKTTGGEISKKLSE